MEVQFVLQVYQGCSYTCVTTYSLHEVGHWLEGCLQLQRYKHQLDIERSTTSVNGQGNGG